METWKEVANAAWPLSITRAKLIDIAWDAIVACQNLDDETIGHLLYAAATMEQVAVGAWAIDENCGCLVGTAMLNEGKSFNTTEIGPYDLKLYSVGVEFDDRLTETLGIDVNRHELGGRVQVID